VGEIEQLGLRALLLGPAQDDLERAPREVVRP